MLVNALVSFNSGKYEEAVNKLLSGKNTFDQN
jgi:hypothetical protein